MVNISSQDPAQSLLSLLLKFECAPPTALMSHSDISPTKQIIVFLCKILKICVVLMNEATEETI